MTDPIADCFSRIRNAGTAGHDNVTIPYSKMKESLVNILTQEGLVAGYEVVTATEGSRKNIVVRLRYEADGKPMIQRIRRMSTPGQRVYRPAPKKLDVRSGLGFQILSTSKGVMTDREALEKRVGGELVAEVW